MGGVLYLGVGVLIDDSMVDDTFRPVSVPKGGQGLLKVLGGGAYRGNHNGLAITPKIVL